MKTLVGWVIAVVVVALGVFFGLLLWVVWGDSLSRRAKSLLQTRQKPVGEPLRHLRPEKQNLRPLPAPRESKGPLAGRHY